MNEAVRITSNRRREALLAALLAALLSPALLAEENSRACFDGDAAACQQKRAVDEAKCAQQDVQGCLDAGEDWDDLQRGLSAPGDVPRAAKLYGTACDLKSLEGCFQAAYIFENATGKLHDLKRAISMYRKSCTAGHAQSCQYLGTHYREGTGVKRDRKKGTSLIDRGCRLDDAGACEQLWEEAEQAHDAKASAKYHDLGCKAGECPSW